jgi:hypothetical protein
MAELLKVKVGNNSFKKFLEYLKESLSPTIELTYIIPELNTLNYFNGNPDIYIKNEITNFLSQKGGAKYSQKGGFPPSALICYLLVIWFFGIITVVESTRLEELFERKDIIKQKSRELAERRRPKYGFFYSIFFKEFSREELAEFNRLEAEIAEDMIEVDQRLSVARMEAESAANMARADADTAEAVLTHARSTQATVEMATESARAAQRAYEEALHMAQNQYNIRDIIGALGIGMAIMAIIQLCLNQQLARNGNEYRVVPRRRNADYDEYPEQLPGGRDEINRPRPGRREISNVAAPGNPPPIHRLMNGSNAAAPPVILLPPPNPGFNSPRGTSGGRTKNKKGKTRRRTKKNKRY